MKREIIEYLLTYSKGPIEDCDAVGDVYVELDREGQDFSRSRDGFLSGRRVDTCMDAMDEVLLTVWALSQEIGNNPTLNSAFPKRLQSTLRKARKLEYVVVDDQGVYLDEGGSAYLAGKNYRI